ncbi:hypothetical protein [Virgisporangium aurantiacum]|uniref:CBM11 domain-containing protein n=1 Tax=Virgisporangium aurantiacum TaxID=175570 RepID=A0A8J3Z589_9ACTN|nr:hypothetical protein [Virgisporangium aurantiacum]GIJ57122.1 hypothetical protein Vau01_046380 [Virgisporangium aurantiacum]
MKRVFSVAAMAVLLLTFAGPASAAPIARESFEAGFGPWVPDTDGRAPTSSVTLSTDQAYDGVRSVRIFMDGRKDDGTSWVEAQFVGPPMRQVRVNLSFQLWSPGSGAAGGWLVVGFAGTGDPEVETDFTRIGYTDVVAGWRPYQAGWTFRTDATGRFRVALGTSVIWEVQKAHHIDAVRVDLVTV